MEEPAHKILVHRYLQMERVEARLSQYHHIAAHYRVDDFIRCSEQAPYYCHYLAWRLGVWDSPEWCSFLDDLFATAMLLDGWNNGKVKKGLFKDCRYEALWQLLWELQVAKFFTGIEGAEVQWLNAGPDLKISTVHGSFYIECYTYTKSFGIMEFISELFSQIDPRISVQHAVFNKLSLPKDNNTDAFLDRVFRPILEQPALQENTVLSRADNFIVYVKGDDPLAEPPSELVTLLMNTGNPEKYLQVALPEALGAKIDENHRLTNGLEDHHPHVLAINFLLSPDYQVAQQMQVYLDKSLQLPDTWEKYDGVLLTFCGIHELPSVGRSYTRCKLEEHPLLALFDAINGIASAR